jgi:potassium efflux system protein
MGTTWAGRLAIPLGLLLIFAPLCRGDEPAPPSVLGDAPAAPATSPEPPPAPKKAAPPGDVTPATTATAAQPDGEKAAADKGTSAVAGTTAGLDANTVRAETTEALKRLTKPSDPNAPAPAATSKALRELLEERIHWLDEWDKTKAAEARHLAEPRPERQTAALKADLERVRAQLEQAAKDPESLLPGVFRNAAGPVTDATRAEMKEAVEAAKSESHEASANLEKLRASTAGASNTVSPLRVDRDRTHQRVAALKSRSDEREAAVATAKTPDEVMLARERLVNFRWESQVETERLALLEAQLTYEAARPDLAALNLQVLEAHAQLAARTLDRIQRRYAVVTQAQEDKLKQDAIREQNRAANSDDPLEKYRARRTAELLELQALVLKIENPPASKYPVFEEQRSLADQAENDFAAIKALLDDGKVSRLDALRLNLNFRRIGPERARIISHELAAAVAHSAILENALNSVEIDMIDAPRNDRLQNEDLLQRLPRARQDKAKEFFTEFEANHLRLLERKRAGLEKLAQRAELTHQEIERRLASLEQQYGFIRTHIFWVRDQEPIGAVTLLQCQGELAILGRLSVPLVREACDPSLWGRVSPEFAAAALALLVLPWPLVRLRKSLCPSFKGART